MATFDIRILQDDGEGQWFWKVTDAEDATRTWDGHDKLLVNVLEEVTYSVMQANSYQDKVMHGFSAFNSDGQRLFVTGAVNTESAKALAATLLVWLGEDIGKVCDTLVRQYNGDIDQILPDNPIIDSIVVEECMARYVESTKMYVWRDTIRPVLTLSNSLPKGVVE